VILTAPIRTVSEANRRDHWSVKAERAKGQRGPVALLCRSKWGAPPRPPLTVTLTRLSPGTLDDDNLRGALKAVRDGVADYLGINDRDPRVEWEYEQQRHKAFGVRIEMSARYHRA